MPTKIINVSTHNSIFKILRPRKVHSLIRVGGFQDGGYVVPSECLDEITRFVNFGVGENFEFERELFKRFGVDEIKSFDSLVSLKYFIIRLLKGFVKFLLFRAPISSFLDRLLLLIKFIDFYKLNPGVTFKKVFIDKLEAESICLNCPDNSGLKVDIEHNEYPILNTISENSSKFLFIIIEFHSVPTHEKQIIEFFNKINSEFYIAHLSLNNRCADIHASPQTIEVTFCRIREDFNGFVDSLPNADLDWHVPNRPIYRLDYKE